MGSKNRELKILLVDDNEAVRKTLEMVLVGRGYSVVSAESGAAALAVISSYLPDILLCDVNLPDENGIDVAVEICRRLRNCRMILISGDPETSQALRRGARDGHQFEILAKPVPPAELFAILEGRKPPRL